MYDDPGGWDEDAARPYFFLSYAHTPRAGTRGAGDPNHWVSKLYEDLCDAVLQLTDLPDGAPVGFMDQSMHQGQLWAQRLSQELATCRVFVPLYSPRYFNSVACGQEWHSFTQRPVFPERQSSERTSGIVPVLWIAMGQYQLPEVASQLQFNHRSFGPDYAAEGLYALMKLSYFRSSYEVAVHRLAARIVDVAEETVIPVGRRLDFQSQPSAFKAQAPPKPLRISVFSYRQSELPEGRSPEYYGPQRTDWHPYQPHAGKPLAEHAVRLAKQLGFQPSVHEFDQEADELLTNGEPSAPGLVLLDRWALQDAERQEIVRKFDSLNPSWVSVLEPWNTTDPDCVEQDQALSELSGRILRLKHREVKPSFQGDSSGLATLQDFDDALPRAAMRAKWAFEDLAKAGQGDQGSGQGGQPGSPRPSLRAAFGEPRPADRSADRSADRAADRTTDRAAADRAAADRASDRARRRGDEEDGPPPGTASGGGEA
ncbi:TIR-like protein FxsC [Kitasatospora sp. MAP5-34]|uniref:TIR-like protein FxsC n=1 Tax=Kitasatospora sp. MAP5-34 TaxID=3035102 RepID=UPI002473DE78|nr:TIR-like protein FxsC [Kitasatospora sp. MAP5-34]MDH6577613.1 FxsC-like protein [Kitasatospora sp. MAP5-34]